MCRRTAVISVLFSVWLFTGCCQVKGVEIRPKRIRHVVRSVNSSSTATNNENEQRFDLDGHNSNNRHRVCTSDGQIEYRLTKLEIQLAEKSELLRSDLRDASARLRTLEHQSSDVESALHGFRNELARFTESATTPLRCHNPDVAADNTGKGAKFELRIDNLTKGVQLVVAALRVLNADVNNVKKNLTVIANDTNRLVRSHNDLVTKPFLSQSLVDVKHHQNQPYYHPRQEVQEQLSELPARDCRELLERGTNVSGIYRIKPDLAAAGFMVLCDMHSAGGGWTYIHNRYDGSQDFYLDWHSYKIGFGNLAGEFWLGLDHIHELTGNEVHELLIDLTDGDSANGRAQYAAFSLGNELEGYSLKILAGYTGTAGDSLIYHAGTKFSTKDMDQDNWVEGSCAQSHGGAWWYRSCDTSNLNGKYFNGELPAEFLYQGMYWGEFRGPQYSLKRARMMVRRRGQNSDPWTPEGIHHF